MKKYILTPLAGIALLLMGLLFACDDQEAPHNTAPVLTTCSVEVGGRTTATLSGTIAFPDETEVTECGFIYSTVPTLPEEESTVVPVNVSQLPGTLSVELTGLQPATHYYYCLYASSGYTVLRSEIKEFDTAADGVPTFGEVTYTNVTETTADVTCRLTDDGGYDILTLGFCYKPVTEGDTETPSQEDFVVNVKEDAITLTATLTHLSPSQTYAVCAYGTNQKGVGYSEPVTFTTKQSVTPTAETGEAADITETSATLTGRITYNGGADILAKGFFWSTDETTVKEGTRTYSAAEGDTILSTLEGLSVETTYYYCAYAENERGMAYGEVCSFLSGGHRTAPTVQTAEATDITETSAVLHGRIEKDGGSPVTSRGFYYSTRENPAEGGIRVAASGNGADFAYELTGLSGGTTYYVCSFATNEIGTTYGETITFTTAQPTTPPTLSVTTVSNIGETAATLTAEITHDGGLDITEKGFYYSSTNSSPTAADNQAVSAASGNTLTATLNSLEPHTTYYVRAYAINAKGTGLGAVQQFTTADDRTAPIVQTGTASAIGENTATLSASITADGGSPVTAKGFYYSTTNTPATDGTRVNATGEGNDFSVDLTGLRAGTTYYFCAFAENEVGTSYGQTQQFSTSTATSAPAVGATAATEITTTSALLTAEITSDGGLPITAKGFYYSSTNSTPTEADSHVESTAEGNSIRYALTGLTAHTTYYVRAYATNERGTTMGAVRSFTTSDDRTVPVVQTTDVTNITQSEATFSGEVTADGGSTVTATGFYYGTSAQPQNGGRRVEAAATDGAFTYDVAGLTASTQYYVCAFAENEVGTSYGDVLSFTTGLALSIPSVGATTVSAITTTTASASATITSTGGADVTEKGFYYSLNNPPTASDQRILSTAADDEITADLSGLQPATRYYIRAFATNSEGTAVGSINLFTTAYDTTTPTIGSVTAADTTSTSVDLMATIMEDGGASITEKGFCYTTTAGATPTVNDQKAVDSSTGNDIILTLTGLSPNTVYYIRAYATNNSGKTGYSNTITVRTITGNAPDIDDNPSPER